MWASSGMAQSIEAGFNTLAGTKGQLPTWLWANQLGRYDQYSSAIQNFELLANYKTTSKDSDFGFEGHAQLNFLWADKTDLRFTELFAGANWKFLQVKIGAFAEPEAFMGLSASNGNLAYSRNARPHSRIRAGFNDFVPLISDWFSIYGFWEEGLLNDDRYIADTHLHHKAFYFRIGNLNTIQITAGLEHYVMWGGTHPTFGELPGWKDYFSYVMGSSGGDNALPSDQQNVLGNGFGTYQIEIKKAWDKLQTTFYISHPFDDRSGMELQNWRDNLYGFFMNFNRENALIGLVLEYYYTKHQSGSYHLKPQPDGTNSGRGMDNYFNNGYRSGVTYHQMAMVSPLFAPLVLEDGISLGFENNRIEGVHMGANGYLSTSLQWKGMLTYTSNFGRYQSGGTTSYNPKRKQVASLLQLSWQLPEKPILFTTTFAADHGSLFDEGETISRIGGMFSIVWKIRQ